MTPRNFSQLVEALQPFDLKQRIKAACVGLDTVYEKIPTHIRNRPHTLSQNLKLNRDIFEFNKDIIDHTKEHVGFYKPNSAFYEQYGPPGIEALQQTIEYIHKVAPHVVVILDYKRGDIGDTNICHCKVAFEYYNADAVTVHGYLGKEAMQPFLDYTDKGIIVLCKTSNKGSSEFQDEKVPEVFVGQFGTMPLFHKVAYNVETNWNTNKNCGLVTGGTYPIDIGHARLYAPSLFFLIPGIGKQGGDLEGSVKHGLNKEYRGIGVNSSSGIIYASSGEDFAIRAGEEIRKLDDGINDIRFGLIGALR